MPLGGVLKQGFETLRRPVAPHFLVADYRSTVNALGMTNLAGAFYDLFAGYNIGVVPVALTVKAVSNANR